MIRRPQRYTRHDTRVPYTTHFRSKVPGIDQETGAASFSCVLAAVPDLDPEVGYTVMQAIFDHAEDVRSLGVQFEDIRLDFGAKYLVGGFPINKGAARYFKEKGVWTDDMIEAS